ncbi:vesicle-associated membrane protein 3 [Onychomys torridus]|uniref:vesicle-associated membrane protein 3 n=1 Tax=Onychomys torridus TaxID=38674 RepID=UPI00167F8789|nr:vesicle-associated membrane protein 3 [Onychomys torridus]
MGVEEPVQRRRRRALAPPTPARALLPRRALTPPTRVCPEVPAAVLRLGPTPAPPTSGAPSAAGNASSVPVRPLLVTSPRPRPFHSLGCSLHHSADPRLVAAAAAAAAKMSTGAPSGSSSAATGSSRRLQQTQNQVDEVVDIMRVNVDKVLERDQKLSELDDRADALQAGASQFETSAAKLKRKYWWKNCKMWAIGISVLVIVVIIIVVWSVS